MDANGGVFHIQTIRLDIRIADAGKVRRDDGECFGEERDHRLPHQRCLRVTVQQDQRRAASGRKVMELGAFDGCGAGGDRSVSGRGLSCDWEWNEQQHGDADTKRVLPNVSHGRSPEKTDLYARSKELKGRERLSPTNAAASSRASAVPWKVRLDRVLLKVIREPSDAAAIPNDGSRADRLVEGSKHETCNSPRLS